MLRYTALLYFVAISLQASVVLAQGAFVEIPKNEVMECLMDFVANREKFQSYGCSMSFKKQLLRSSGLNESSWEACVFEVSSEKLRRVDLKRIDLVLGNDGRELRDELPIWSTYSSKGKSKIYEGNAEVPFDRLEKMERYHSVPDPWMAAISESHLLDAGKAGGANYWLTVFDESRLLWAESNNEFIRGEWVFGTGEGETFVQAYFSRRLENLPVLVRYLVPHDKKQKFQKKGIFVSENEIVWNLIGDGYVPSEIRFQREDFFVQKAGTKFSSHGVMTLKWKSRFCDDEGTVDENVFRPKGLSFEQVKSSFDVGANPAVPVKSRVR